MTETTKKVLLGHIAGAHGIRGEVLIKSYTEAAEDIAAYGPLMDEKSGRTFRLKVMRVTPKGVIARIDGVSDRNGAEALKGVRLVVDRGQLPEADVEEFYHADLIGLRAVDGEGRTIGRVVAVANYGAGDLIEIELAATRKTELVPFKTAFVPSVDIGGGTITIVLPVASEDDDETRATSG
jgi:16S rRNA processing protein RimM